MRVCSYCHLAVSESDATCPHDGSAVDEVQPVRVPGGVHARFPAVEPFARGATGGLFLAVQAQSGYRGLLKILSPELLSSQAERSRLKRELRKQTALTHNALTRIIDGGEAGNDLWLFREYVQGESLAIVLRRQGALRVPDALAIAAQVASALDELHRQGLLHRDIKPGHVLLTPRPDAVPLVSLIDAGIAARLPTGSVFELMGTPAYASPELLAGKPASFRSDLYSLGCMLYEMLTGTPPFVRDSVEATLAAHREQEPKEPDVDLPPAVRALLTSLMAKEPRKRPFSAQQVRRALDPYLPPTTPEPSSGSRTLSGTMSAPPSAAGRVSSAVPVPAAGQRSSAPQVPQGRGSAPSSPQSPPGLRPPPGLKSAPVSRDTQEIDLDAEPIETWPEQHTEEIDLTELDESRLRGDTEATVVVPNPVGAAMAVAALSGAKAEAEGTTDEPESPVEAAPAEPAPAEEPVEAEQAVSAPSPVPADEPQTPSGRPAVDFDVESLFDDGTEPEKPVVKPPADSQPLHGRVGVDAQDAPTGLYIPSAEPFVPVRVMQDPPAPSRGSRPAPLPKPAEAVLAQGTSPSREDDATDAPTIAVRTQSAPTQDPEGTVVMRRADVRPKPPIAMIVGTAVATLVVLGVSLRMCRSESETTTGAVPVEQLPPSAAAPAPRQDAPGNAPQNAPQENPAQGAPEQAAAQPAAAATPEAQPTAADEAAATAATAEADAKPARGAAKDAKEAKDTKDTKARQPGVVPYKAPPAAEPGVDYKARALKLYQAGKYREAALEYEKATQVTPSDAGAYAGLGASWLSANQPDRAILAYQRAVQLKPKVSGFHAALGRAYLQKNDRGRALAAYRKAAELDPNNQAAQNALRTLAQ